MQLKIRIKEKLGIKNKMSTCKYRIARTGLKLIQNLIERDMFTLRFLGYHCDLYPSFEYAGYAYLSTCNNMHV